MLPLAPFQVSPAYMIFMILLALAPVIVYWFIFKATLNDILVVVAYICASVFILFFVLSIIYLIGAYVVTAVGYDSNSIGVLNVSSTIVLTIVTLVYVMLTYLIVKESKNWNRIIYLNSKLEKFYYPLSQRLGDYSSTGDHENFNDFETLLKETSSFLYLANSKDVKDTFTKLRNCQRNPFKDSNDLDVIDNLITKLLELINRDIEKLESRLNKLTK